MTSTHWSWRHSHHEGGSLMCHQEEWCLTQWARDTHLHDCTPTGKQMQYSSWKTSWSSKCEIKKKRMLNVQIYTYALKFDLWVAYSKLVVYALLKLAPKMSWMCVNVCVGRVGTGEGTLEVDFTGVFPWKERLRSAVVCVSLSCSRGETGTSCASCGRLRIQGREE